MFYFFWLRFLTPLARLIYRVRYVGKENIPREGKLIVCSNHKSVVDPFLLAMPFKRQIRFMAKSELFTDHGKLAAWILRKGGAFPVHRDKGDAESVRTAIDILQDGGIVGIFAQGKCVFDNAPFKPKAGVALVASRTTAPILPCSIYCDGVLKPFRRVTVRFGEVIPYEKLQITGNSLREIRSATDIIAKQVNAQLEEKY